MNEIYLYTGEKNVRKKKLAKPLKRAYLGMKNWFILEIGSVLYIVDAGIEEKIDNRKEHIRRVSEVSNILLDTGLLLILTAIELTQDDLEIFKGTIGAIILRLFG